MKKFIHISVIASVTSYLFFGGVAFAQSNLAPNISAGYYKGNNQYDLVVKDSPNIKVRLYTDGKKSGETKVNKLGWATFKKVTFVNSGKLTFSQTSKSNSNFQSVAYTKYFLASNNALFFYDKDPAVSSPIGTRTKTSGCVISSNREQDSGCTPGAVFTNVTKDMVCRKGYSSSVRNVSSSTKNQVYAEYGITSHKSGEFEVDHLVSLELGGSNTIANLWPEAASPTPGFHQKDSVENKLHSEVCSGKISLTEAQNEIVNDWLQVYLGTFLSAPAKTTPTPAAATTTSSPAPAALTAPTEQPAQSTGVVKMSTTHICHAPGTTYYDRTLNYTPYDTLQACLDAGGRLPLR